MYDTLLQIVAKTNNLAGAVELMDQVEPMDNGTHAMVKSQSSDALYRVKIDTEARMFACTCPQARHRRACCKHIAAFALYLIHHDDSKYVETNAYRQLAFNAERLVFCKERPKTWRMIEGYVKSSTLKALCVRMGDGRTIWLPKSQMAVDAVKARHIKAYVAKWVLEHKQHSSHKRAA